MRGEHQLLGVGAQRGVPLRGAHDGQQVVAVLAQLVEQLSPLLRCVGCGPLRREHAGLEDERREHLRVEAVGLQVAVGGQRAQGVGEAARHGVAELEPAASSSTPSC